MAVEILHELILHSAKIPALINNSARSKFRADFIIRCICHVEILGSRHTIISKRTLSSRGNRPGIMLHIHGTRVELLTFGDNDKRWHVTASKHRSIMAGQRYEILAGRKGGKGLIYIDGLPNLDYVNTIQSDQPEFTGGVSLGDINCDEPFYVGVTHYNGHNFWKFDGQIEFLGIYNSYELPQSILKTPPRRTWIYADDFRRVRDETRSRRLIL